MTQFGLDYLKHQETVTHNRATEEQARKDLAHKYYDTASKERTSKYSADSSAKASKYAADTSAASHMYSADRSYDAAARSADLNYAANVLKVDNDYKMKKLDAGAKIATSDKFIPRRTAYTEVLMGDVTDEYTAGQQDKSTGDQVWDAISNTASDFFTWAANSFGSIGKLFG